jgi:hypothetical protein
MVPDGLSDTPPPPVSTAIFVAEKTLWGQPNIRTAIIMLAAILTARVLLYLNGISIQSGAPINVRINITPVKREITNGILKNHLRSKL